MDIYYDRIYDRKRTHVREGAKVIQCRIKSKHDKKGRGSMVKTLATTLKVSQVI